MAPPSPSLIACVTWDNLPNLAELQCLSPEVWGRILESALVRVKCHAQL